MAHFPQGNAYTIGNKFALGNDFNQAGLLDKFLIISQMTIG
jgi:hypothetical protein